MTQHSNAIKEAYRALRLVAALHLETQRGQTAEEIEIMGARHPEVDLLPMALRQVTEAIAGMEAEGVTLPSAATAPMERPTHASAALRYDDMPTRFIDELEDLLSEIDAALLLNRTLHSGGHTANGRHENTLTIHRDAFSAFEISVRIVDAD
jgi:hypothetical protein